MTFLEAQQKASRLIAHCDKKSKKPSHFKSLLRKSIAEVIHTTSVESYSIGWKDGKRNGS